MSADKNKGWTFTFNVEGVDDPVRVVVLGEVGDTTQNKWAGGDSLYYLDDDHAQSIAHDAIADEYNTSIVEDVTWAETAKYHPDHLVGLKDKGFGVWI